MTKKRSAAEIIAFNFCLDIGDVREYRYQPTRYTAPAIFAMGEFYYCSPSSNQSPPKSFGTWQLIGEHYGRKIYRAGSSLED